MTLKVHVHLNNPSLYALRQTGALEATLAAVGEQVEWVEAPLTTTPGRGQDLALLRDGTADVVGTGVTPPLTGQGLGVELAYLGYGDPRPDHGAIVVRADGPVAEAIDLEGRRVAYGIGSWQTLFLAAALDRGGVPFASVEGVASDDESLAALRAGTLDAVILQGADYRAAARADDLRVLARVGDVISNRSLWFARRDLARERPEVVAAVAVALAAVHTWAPSHVAELAEIHAAEAGGAAEDWRAFLADVPWSFSPVDDAFLREQQAAADLLHGAAFLPEPIVVAEAQLPELDAAVRDALRTAATAGLPEVRLRATV